MIFWCWLSCLLLLYVVILNKTCACVVDKFLYCMNSVKKVKNNTPNNELEIIVSAIGELYNVTETIYNDYNKEIWGMLFVQQEKASIYRKRH